MSTPEHGRDTPGATPRPRDVGSWRLLAAFGGSTLLGFGISKLLLGARLPSIDGYFESILFISALVGCVLASSVGVLLLCAGRKCWKWFAPWPLGGLVLAAACVSGAFLGLLVFVHGPVHERELRKQGDRSFAESVVTRLEEFRRIHGKYPASLTDLPGDAAGAEPGGELRRIEYASDGKEFVLSPLAQGMESDTPYYDSRIDGWTAR